MCVSECLLLCFIERFQLHVFLNIVLLFACATPTDLALTKASPKTVRRIKNKLAAADEQSNSLKRRSTTHSEVLAQTPKVFNWTGSGNLNHSDASRGHLHSSFSSIQTPPSQGDGEGAKRRVVRHSYEDVDISRLRAAGEGGGQDEERKKQEDSRTISWINHHQEMNWGRDAREREMQGSMWSSRNREQQRSTSKDKLRQPQPPLGVGGGKRGGRAGRTEEDSRDIFASYQGPSPQPSYRQHLPGSSSSSSVSSVPQPHLPSSNHRTFQSSTSSSSGTLPKSRRTSYMTAMGEPADLPVRESPTHHRTRREREDRFTTSEQVAPRHQPSGIGGSIHGRGQREPWNLDVAGQAGRYNVRPSPSPHGTQQRVNKYNGLQRDIPSPSSAHVNSLTRRRSSDAMELSPVRQGSTSGTGHHYQQQQQQHHQQHQRHQQQRSVSRDGLRPHRTYSNDKTHGGGGVGGEEIPHHPILHSRQGIRTPPLLHPHPGHHTPPQTAQVESYI